MSHKTWKPNVCVCVCVCVCVFVINFVTRAILSERIQTSLNTRSLLNAAGAARRQDENIC